MGIHMMLSILQGAPLELGSNTGNSAHADAQETGIINRTSTSLLTRDFCGIIYGLLSMIATNYVCTISKAQTRYQNVLHD